MAVKLRLMRLGRRGQPFYRIVAVDSRKKRDGAYLDKIGYYNPLTKPAEVVVDDEKALKWLKNGAIPSDTVRSLLSRRGVMLALALQKRGVTSEEIKARVESHRAEKEAKLRAIHEKRAAAAKPAPVAAEPEQLAPVVAEPEQPAAAPEPEPPSATEEAAQPEAPPEENA